MAKVKAKAKTAKAGKAKKSAKAPAKKAAKPAKKSVAKNIKAKAKSAKPQSKVNAKKATMKTAIAMAKQPKAKAAPKISKAAPATVVAAKTTLTKSVSAPAIGKTAPDLDLLATGGQTLNLSQMNGKKVVLYFYPKDMTPGCTIEGHEFTKLKNEFEAQNTVVLGVSRDTVELHEKFKAKECYTIDLLADTDAKLCNTFDVIKDKNMYGKMVKGIERSTFLIDENGKVVQEWRGVKAEGHAGEVLSYLKGSN